MKKIIQAAPLAAAFSLFFAFGCSDSGSDEGGGPASLRRQVETTVEKAPMFVDAFNRVDEAVRTGSAPDVTLTENGAVTMAAVLVDMDGDGTRETEVSCRITFNEGRSFAQGANVSARSAFGSEGASGDVTVNEVGTKTVTEISGDFSDSSGDELFVIQGNLEVSPSGNTIVGEVEFYLLRGQETGSGAITGTLFFEDDDNDGYQIRAVADDGSFSFVVRR